jgi:hypothetical protein
MLSSVLRVYFPLLVEAWVGSTAARRLRSTCPILRLSYRSWPRVLESNPSLQIFSEVYSSKLLSLQPVDSIRFVKRDSYKSVVVAISHEIQYSPAREGMATKQYTPKVR